MPPPTTTIGRGRGSRVGGSCYGSNSIRRAGIGPRVINSQNLETDALPTVDPAASTVPPARIRRAHGSGSSERRPTTTSFALTEANRRVMNHNIYEPDIMENHRAKRLLRKFSEKVGTKIGKYELVAGFYLENGIILTYYQFRTMVHFEITERRRKLLSKYYNVGEQEVILYIDRSDFEYYVPVPCYRKSTVTPLDSGYNYRNKSTNQNDSERYPLATRHCSDEFSDSQFCFQFSHCIR